MSAYRKFTASVERLIIARATVDGLVECERCRVWCKNRRDYQIDHVLAERMRPEADKRRRLVPADGQLLCLRCHDKKTKRDVGAISVAKRREARARTPVRGQTEIQRRFGS